MTKPKFVGREIELDGKTGTIIYANSVEVLVQYPDNSRERVDKNYAAFLLDLEDFKLPGQ